MKKLLQKRSILKHYSKYNYDVTVIGSGSGGMAFANRAAILNPNLKIAVLDFVKPSTQGTKWGIGGTCINVGCIPKKLMHTASIHSENFKQDMPSFGFEFEGKQTHNWETLVKNVNNYIKSLQFGIKVDFRNKNIKLFENYGVLKDPNTVEMTDKKGNKTEITTDKVIIAVGGRPQLPDIPGALEYGITSDDIFSMKKAPGKTLVIGGSYVALETAGFLTGLGYDTTVMIRSIPLRGFDQQCANYIVEDMKHLGTKFLQESIPVKIEKINEKLHVTFEKEKNLFTEEYDTVMFAIGRKGVTQGMNLKEIGVKLDKNDKIIVNEFEQTSVPNIYALGDIKSGGIELTPVAIMAGSTLAKYLYGGHKVPMNYDLVPSTVFTPLEYGVCGLSEEEAIRRYGNENIEVYHVSLNPLEHHLSRHENRCYMKQICLKTQNEKVIGFHILSPNAGEITQGVAVAMKMGATKKDFDDTVGIHPTIAEEITINRVTKSSGVSFEKGGC